MTGFSNHGLGINDANMEIFAGVISRNFFLYCIVSPVLNQLLFPNEGRTMVGVCLVAGARFQPKSDAISTFLAVGNAFT